MKCNQCGNHISEYEQIKKCPQCGNSLFDEVKQKARKTYRFALKHLIIVSLLILAILGMSVIAWESSRHYSWQEQHTSIIKEKDHWTSTYVYCSGDPPICFPIITHHYDLKLEDGYKDSISSNQYDSVSIGDSWIYTHTHTDWKPGMKNAPIPTWVFLMPLIGAGILFLFLYMFIIARRQKEINEWKKSGDLRMG